MAVPIWLLTLTSLLAFLGSLKILRLAVYALRPFSRLLPLLGSIRLPSIRRLSSFLSFLSFLSALLRLRLLDQLIQFILRHAQ